jgi:hypothetical protein
MIDGKIIDDLADKMSQIIPPEMKNIHQQLREQLRQLLQAQLAKMDLVTREEFDIQVQVLQKTRQKLSELEARLAELEQQHRQDSPSQ